VCEIAHTIKPSPRGELEITDLNRLYLEAGELQVEVLGRGNAWLDTGSPDSLFEAAEFVRVIQHRQGLKISCLEEIGYNKHWITREELSKAAAKLGKTEYGDYLRKLSQYDHTTAAHGPIA